ncbi:MAG: response regulator [Patescibacteria group bacterium]
MGSKKILVVEDDSFLLSMYSTKLNLENFKVSTATTGLQALKVVAKDQPDLILLDLNLPEMSGFDVLDNLKKDVGTKDIPVIVLTNYSQKENIDKCFALGAVDYLIKAHFVPAEVVDKIKKILNK